VLSVLTVARPRNQLNRHEKVARFWRPFRLLGGTQLNPELTLIRNQDDRIDKPSEHL
jgi:hypothetical protein